MCGVAWRIAESYARIIGEGVEDSMTYAANRINRRRLTATLIRHERYAALKSFGEI